MLNSHYPQCRVQPDSCFLHGRLLLVQSVTRFIFILSFNQNTKLQTINALCAHAAMRMLKYPDVEFLVLKSNPFRCQSAHTHTQTQ